MLFIVPLYLCWYLLRFDLAALEIRGVKYNFHRDVGLQSMGKSALTSKNNGYTDIFKASETLRLKLALAAGA
jgi:hypothetical protein